MSKIAEEKAWKAYPYVRGTKGLICENLRPVFIRGYEQAEKDLKDALLEWAKGFTDTKIFVSTLIAKLEE